jgi:hypothetical protein
METTNHVEMNQTEAIQQAQYFKTLIDKRIDLKFQIERLKEQLDQIDAEIKEDFEIGEILLGSDGYGYKVGVTEKLNYGQNVIRSLKEKDLLDGFVTISTTKLESLCKAGKLSYAELDKFRELAEVKQTKTILQFIPEELKQCN